MNVVLEYLRKHQDDMLADLRELVERESPTTDKPLVDDMAVLVAAYAERMSGGRATILPQAEWGNHVRVEIDGAAGEAGPTHPNLLLVGHFDTVWPAGTLAQMPFRVDGGRAYGPGAFDMKAGLVQGFWALRALREVGAGFPPVVFLLNSEEEMGSPTSRSLIEEEARRAAVCMVLEPSSGGAVKTARKGVGIFHVHVTGKAAHAGSDPFEGVSAIEELCRLTLDLHEQTSRESGTTVNVGVVRGGTRSNVIAASAEAEVDLRVATTAEAVRMERLILDLGPHNLRAKVAVEGGMNRPPMERTARVVRLYEHTRALAAELGFPLREASVGGGSDGNFCAAVNPSVIDGLGAVGAGGHALHEHVLIGHLAPRAALLARLLQTVLTI
jgi:glutamate carboxypeptidase